MCSCAFLSGVATVTRYGKGHPRCLTSGAVSPWQRGDKHSDESASNLAALRALLSDRLRPKPGHPHDIS